eukprot:10790836-Alexandrium_andersonii.AAC.1
MSASLVGSEMCIRDSTPCAERVGAAPWTADAGLARHLPRGRPRRGHLLAVSYTHLTLPTICSV